MMSDAITKDEQNSLLLSVFNIEVNDCKQLMNPPVKVLEKQSVKIDAASITYGLLESCRHGQAEMVSFILKRLGNIKAASVVDRLYTYVFAERHVGVRAPERSVTIISTPVRVISLLKAEDVSMISRSNTLLHLAAEGNHLPVVQILIKAGASIDPVNCCGRTPLMVGTNSFKMTKTLLSAGARVDIRDKRGLTALLIAVENGASSEVIALLLEYGSDPRVRDKSGYSFLHWAYSLKRSIVSYTGLMAKKGIRLTCSDSGLLLSDGVPLCIASIEPRLLEDQDENPFLSKEVRLSLKYLKPSLHLFNLSCTPESMTEYKTALNNALKFKAYYKLSILYPSQVQLAYQSMLEVKTPSEVASLSPTDLMYQNLIIAERVAGYGSFILIWLLLDTISDLIQGRHKIPLLDHAISMLLYRLKEFGVDKKIAVLASKLVHCTRDILCKEGTYNNKEMFANLLSCVKLYLQLFDRLHGHHVVPTTSEKQYRYAEFRGEIMSLMIPAIQLLQTIVDYQVQGAGSLVAEFMQDLPLIIDYNDDIHTPLSIAYNHVGLSTVRLLLEHGADKWIHTRVKNGDFLINLVMSKNRGYRGTVKQEDLSLAGELLQFGMHIDSVDSCGRQLYTTLPQTLLDIYLPNYTNGSRLLLPLTCMAAHVIVNERVPYFGLPTHVKEFVSLHDPGSFRRQIKHILDLP